MTSLFKRALPKKRITPSGKELRSAQGEIRTADFSDFSESDFASSYVSGHNGLRDNPVRAERRVAIESDEMRFGEMADGAVTRVRYIPEAKALVEMLQNHVEPTGDFTYSEGQMRALQSFFSDKKNMNVANELKKLRSLDSAPTAKQRTRRMQLETEISKMKTHMSRLLRSA